MIYKLRKRDKMGGLPSILSLFLHEFNTFNNTGARMLGSIYHDIKITLKSHFWREKFTILPSFKQRYNGRHYATY